jgi:hypothetical protein
MNRVIRGGQRPEMSSKASHNNFMGLPGQMLTLRYSAELTRGGDTIVQKVNLIAEVGAKKTGELLYPPVLK